MRRYTFGNASRSHLAECDPLLQSVIIRALMRSYVDFAVLEGYRNEEKQNAAYDRGASKIQWPDGRHNQFPSQAVDLSPSPQDWSNLPKTIDRFYLLAGAVLAASEELGIPLRWGGDWDGDRSLSDQTFDDLGHFELIPTREA